MDARKVINQVRESGATIHVEEKRIVITPVSVISDELQVLIRQNRSAVFNALQTARDCLLQLATEKMWADYGQQVAMSEVGRVMLDKDGLEDCSEQQLHAWANALVIRMVQARHMVPKGWNRTSRCARCGEVFSDHGLDTLSCGWCWLTVTGKEFPRPDREQKS